MGHPDEIRTTSRLALGRQMNRPARLTRTSLPRKARAGAARPPRLSELSDGIGIILMLF